MPQLLAPYYGLGTDGDYVVSSNVTDAPIDSACTGTINTKTLVATNASFAVGQLILIHQTQGTGAGQWELNRVASYSAGNLGTQLNLTYGYVTGAQVLVVKEYRSVNIQNTFTLAAKLWNGTVGGIIAMVCSGTITVTGNITVSASGFRGGAGGSNATGTQGEGMSGLGVVSNGINGIGGAGGAGGVSFGGGGGGAGGHSATGGGGATQGTNGTGGPGGNTGGSADLTNIIFGGGGGGGGNFNSGGSGPGGAGNTGGGILILIGRIINITGTIAGNGANGGNSAANGDSGGGGGGAGGSFLFKGQVVNLGSASGASGGVGGIGNGSGGLGGAGALGRVRVEAGTITGNITPAHSQLLGGINYLGKVGIL